MKQRSIKDSVDPNTLGRENIQRGKEGSKSKECQR